MTVYYVGVGGSNLNNGSTWALRKATIAAGMALMASGGTDTLYIGPGTYRESISTSVNGASNNPHQVIGDESGVNTDGIGGEVRITGSDNDQTATRASGITCANNWWTFTGLHIDTVTTTAFNVTGNNVVIDESVVTSAATLVSASGASCNNVAIRRSLFLYSTSLGVSFSHSATVNDTNHLVENCYFIGCNGSAALNTTRIGGITVRNSLFAGNVVAVRCITAPAAGQVNNCNNCIVFANSTGFLATATTDWTEDYNAVFGNNTARTNVNTGANSVAWTPLLALPLLSLGIHSWIFGALSANSQIASKAGTGVPSGDTFGTTRVATSSWGPVQYIAGQRFNDAGEPRGRRG